MLKVEKHLCPRSLCRVAESHRAIVSSYRTSTSPVILWAVLWINKCGALSNHAIHNSNQITMPFLTAGSVAWTYSENIYFLWHKFSFIQIMLLVKLPLMLAEDSLCPMKTPLLAEWIKWIQIKVVFLYQSRLIFNLLGTGFGVQFFVYWHSRWLTIQTTESREKDSYSIILHQYHLWNFLAIFNSDVWYYLSRMLSAEFDWKKYC